MRIEFVDLTAQYNSIKDEVDAAIGEVIARAAFIGGEFVRDFEEAFAEFCGAKYCVGVGNGTDAIFIALRACGIGPGDEVLAPANSFVATSEAISMAGASPVFVDIDPVTYNIDVSKAEDQITERTRAIVPVHLFGQPADMDAVARLAKRYDLRVVEDCAQAHGAKFKGLSVGSVGDAGCFSFYPGKNLGAYGDAGAIVTKSEEVAVRARMLANHGRLGKYDHEIEGVNSRLDGIQAAVLNVKLKHLPEWTDRRRQNARLYNEQLVGSGLEIPQVARSSFSVYHLYVVRVSAGLRSGLQSFLSAAGIATGIHYPIALPDLQAYSHLSYGTSECAEAKKAAEQILSLPMYPELRATEIEYIAGKVNKFMSGDR